MTSFLRSGSAARRKREDSRVFSIRGMTQHVAILATLALSACGSHSFAHTVWRSHEWHQDTYRPYRALTRSARHVRHPLQDALPNRSLTTGALNTAVTQADIRQTICVRGYSLSIRPPERYTERLKRLQIQEYGYQDRWLRDYEEDHLVALSLGGSPTSPQNLWPQPHEVVGGWGSYAKDRLESRLHWLVCHRGFPLVTAQRDLANDWIAAYKRYVGPTPDNHKLHWDSGR